MQARYQNGSWGKFISQDPAFLEVGSLRLKDKTGLSLPQYLADPQSFNSYSYARNNPLVYVDKTGNSPLLLLALPLLAYAPQIASYGQFLVSGTGQLGLMQSMQDFNAGHYGWAALGLVPNEGSTLKSSRVTMGAFIDKASATFGRETLEKFGSAREFLMEGVQNKDLRNAIDALYRDKAFIGDGGTADVLRHEFADNGIAKHLIKTQERLVSLEKTVTQKLTGSELQKADFLIKDLRDALKRK